MDNINSLINIPAEKETESVQNDELEILVMKLIERMDFWDVQILRKFYMTGRDFPNDTQPYCFPLLYKELKVSHHLKIGIEALRKRLDNLVKLSLLIKVKQSNPVNYLPVADKMVFIRVVVAKFFLIHGLTKFSNL